MTHWHYRTARQHRVDPTQGLRLDGRVRTDEATQHATVVTTPCFGLVSDSRWQGQRFFFGKEVKRPARMSSARRDGRAASAKRPRALPARHVRGLRGARPARCFPRPGALASEAAGLITDRTPPKRRVRDTCFDRFLWSAFQFESSRTFFFEEERTLY